MSAPPGLQSCWNLDPAPPNVHDLTVKVRVTVAVDGRYNSAQVLDAECYRSDPAFRLVADAAMRAVKNPRCEKIPLPADRIARLMPSFVLTFNPKDMF
jgi:hypothetical protein